MKGDGVLVVGLAKGRYGEAERGGEGVAELGDDPVDEKVEIGANTREDSLLHHPGSVG